MARDAVAAEVEEARATHPHIKLQYLQRQLVIDAAALRFATSLID